MAKAGYSVHGYCRLVEQIYSAGAAPDEWLSTVAAIARATDSSSACLAVASDEFTDIEVHYRLPRELQVEYATGLATIDRLSATARNTPDFVGATSEIFARDPRLRVPAFEARANYYGLAERWGANLSENVGLALHRAPGMAAYGSDDKRFLDRLVPHLRNAVGIHERLTEAQRQRDGLLECIGNLGIGVVLLDARAHVLLVNPCTERIMRDVGVIDIQHSRLVGMHRNDNLQLQSALATVVRGDRPLSCLRLATGESAVELLVCPFRWPHADDASGAVNACKFVVFLTEPEQSVELSLSMLRRLYGLTQAEADVLYLLANDCSVAEIAAIRHVSENTVRTHVQSLRNKTGTLRQSALVKLALTSTARVIGPDRRPAKRPIRGPVSHA